MLEGSSKIALVIGERFGAPSHGGQRVRRRMGWRSALKRAGSETAGLSSAFDSESIEEIHRLFVVRGRPASS